MSRVEEYKVVQLHLSPEIEGFYMLFDTFHSIFSMTTFKHHMDYFNFRSLVQLDLPVL